jgi:hypothetical protein
MISKKKDKNNFSVHGHYFLLPGPPRPSQAPFVTFLSRFGLDIKDSIY